MNLQLLDLSDKYTSLDDLIQAINTFASTQDYVVVKRKTKVSTKEVLKKAVLMCDQSKKYYTKSWNKKETATGKTDCLFDALAVLQTDGGIFGLRDRSHNHEGTLPRAHSTHQKTAKTKKVPENISNHAKTGAPSQQTFPYFCLTHNPENPLFKNQDIYNERLQLGQQNLDRLTPIQILMRTLFENNQWFVRYYLSLEPI